MKQSTYLSVLAASPPAEVKEFVEALLPNLEPVSVMLNRTGLVMLPMRESVQGSNFHLGEVMVAEAQVRLGEIQGYAACLGRDHEQALAIAILDAALQSPEQRSFHPVIVAFVEEQSTRQAVSDELLLRKVAATQVELETF